MYMRIRISILTVSLVLFILSYQTSHLQAHIPNNDTSGLIDSPVIGIDFGHTHTYIGYYYNDTIHIIANISNIVAFTDTNIIIGDDAKPYLITHPKNTITNIKRLLGKRYEDTSVQHDISLLPYELVSQQPYAAVEVTVSGEKKVYTPQDIMGMILTKLKLMVEERLGYTVQYGVYTMPVQSGSEQRSATREAAHFANITLLRVLREPIAAAYAYGIDDDKKDKHVLVFDLGASKLDLTVLDFDSHDSMFEVVSSQHIDIGGNTFNIRIINHYINVIKEKWNIDVTKDVHVWNKLYDAVEHAKRSLSTQESVIISIPSLTDGHDFIETLTRIQFDTLCHDIYDTINTTMNTVLHDGTLEKSDIEDIVLVGGATRIPKLRDLLSSYFSNHTYHLHDTLPPDEIIAHGAAIEASFLSTVIDSDVSQEQEQEDDHDDEDDHDHQHDEL